MKKIESFLIWFAMIAVIGFCFWEAAKNIGTDPPKVPAITKADLQAVKDAGYIEVSRLKAQVQAMKRQIDILKKHIGETIEVPYCGDCPQLDIELIKELHPDLLKEEYR